MAVGVGREPPVQGSGMTSACVNQEQASVARPSRVIVWLPRLQ